MRRLALVLAPLLAGCLHVTSAQPGSPTVTGEAWYTTTRSFMGIPGATNIWYCSDSNPYVCYKAEIREAGKGPPEAKSEDGEEEPKRPRRKRNEDDDSDANRDSDKKDSDAKKDAGDSETKKDRPKKSDSDEDAEAKKPKKSDEEEEEPKKKKKHKDDDSE